MAAQLSVPPPLAAYLGYAVSQALSREPSVSGRRKSSRKHLFLLRDPVFLVPTEARRIILTNRYRLNGCIKSPSQLRPHDHLYFAGKRTGPCRTVDLLCSWAAACSASPPEENHAPQISDGSLAVCPLGLATILTKSGYPPSVGIGNQPR